MEPPTPDPGEEAVLRLPAGPEDAALASPALLRTGDLHCALFTVRFPRRLGFAISTRSAVFLHSSTAAWA